MMRGEEVQILGAVAIPQLDSGVFMPSRHAHEMGGGGEKKNPEYRDFNDRRDVRPDNIVSVLADAMKGWDHQIDAAAFRDGLEIARSGLGGLQCIFITRVSR